MASISSLPGIRSIRLLLCSDLPPYSTMHALCGCTVAIAAPFEEVDFVGRPLLKWEGTVVNGLPCDKATLEFSSRRPLPAGARLAFVVTAADSRQFLVGSREPRFPVVSFTASTGNPDGEAAVFNYKITHIAERTPLACIL